LKNVFNDFRVPSLKQKIENESFNGVAEERVGGSSPSKTGKGGKQRIERYALTSLPFETEAVNYNKQVSAFLDSSRDEPSDNSQVTV